jgi:hypothetical protein
VLARHSSQTATYIIIYTYICGSIMVYGPHMGREIMDTGGAAAVISVCGFGLAGHDRFD